MSEHKIHPRIQEELDHLPESYDDFGYNFRLLVASLNAFGFSVARADEAESVVDSSSFDLNVEMGHPSVLIVPHNASELRSDIESADVGSPKYQTTTNNLTASNLRQQLRLLDLLDGFYDTHDAPSFYSRLIAQTDGVDGTYLKPQGADARVVMPVSSWQLQLYHESNDEFMQFALYLNKKIDEFAD